MGQYIDHKTQIVMILGIAKVDHSVAGIRILAELLGG